MAIVVDLTSITSLSAYELLAIPELRIYRLGNSPFISGKTELTKTAIAVFA